MDPPYAIELKEIELLHRTIIERNLLKEHGELIIEHSKHLDLTSLPRWKDSRKYGGTVFSFFE
jgi:16S rRNA G966 N2-methylase RsmD